MQDTIEDSGVSVYSKELTERRLPVVKGLQCQPSSVHGMVAPGTMVASSHGRSWAGIAVPSPTATAKVKHVAAQQQT